MAKIELICNKCGNSLFDGFNNHGLQNVTSEHDYCSTLDGDRFTFSLCERCLIDLMIGFTVPPEYSVNEILAFKKDDEPVPEKLQRYKSNLMKKID